MALISCPECGKQISDQAPACIHCGYPLPKQPTAPAAPLPRTASPWCSPPARTGRRPRARWWSRSWPSWVSPAPRPRPTWITARWFPLSSCGRG
ncbi:MAG: zinc ribbon domain-containing protein [Flavonifractor plautii]